MTDPTEMGPPLGGIEGRFGQMRQRVAVCLRSGLGVGRLPRSAREHVSATAMGRAGGRSQMTARVGLEGSKTGLHEDGVGPSRVDSEASSAGMSLDGVFRSKGVCRFGT